MAADEWVEAEGATVEAAVKAALEELSIPDESKAQVQVIREPKRGFLGIGRQGALVRVEPSPKRVRKRFSGGRKRKPKGGRQFSEPEQKSRRAVILNPRRAWADYQRERRMRKMRKKRRRAVILTAAAVVVTAVVAVNRGFGPDQQTAAPASTTTPSTTTLPARALPPPAPAATATPTTTTPSTTTTVAPPTTTAAAPPAVPAYELTCDRETDRANIREAQAALDVEVDGAWGPKTNAAWEAECRTAPTTATTTLSVAISSRKPTGPTCGSWKKTTGEYNDRFAYDKDRDRDGDGIMCE